MANSKGPSVAQLIFKLHLFSCKACTSPSPSLENTCSTWRVSRGLVPVEEGGVAPGPLRGVRGNRTDSSSQLLPGKEVGCGAGGAPPGTRGRYLGNNRQQVSRTHSGMENQLTIPVHHC